MRFRFGFITCLTIYCLALSATFLAAAEQPNILLILVDDVGTDAVGCFGGESYPTPNVDRLAASGMKCNHFYVSPVCHPTRVALMTGKYLWSNGNPKWGYFNRGAAEQEILAYRLQNAGYATAAAGKWHLAKLKEDPEQPRRAGFQSSCFFGWHEGPRYWSPLIWQNGQQRPVSEKEYGPDIYSEFLIDFMSKNKDRPFFAYYPLALCHAVSDDFIPRPAHGPQGRYHTFAEMMAEMDKYVGKVVNAVDDLGLRKNTLIVFLTDNGTTPHNFIRHEGKKLIREDPIVSQHHGKSIPGGKGKFTDWGIRVPAILSWPGKIPPASQTNALLDLTDIAPTLMQLAGATVPEGEFDGQSFASLVNQGEHKGREWICVQNNKAICVRDRTHKLVSDGRLFRVSDSLHEEVLIGKKDTTQEDAAARERLTGYLNQVRAKAPQGVIVP